MAAQSGFSSHRCSFLFGAGGIVVGAGIESNLGNDVILNSPAFTQKTPTPPANQDSVTSSCARQREEALIVGSGLSIANKAKDSKKLLSPVWEEGPSFMWVFSLFETGDLQDGRKHGEKSVNIPVPTSSKQMMTFTCYIQQANFKN